MRCHHYCNEPLRCPECVRRFWMWAQNHTRGRERRQEASHDSFYVCASRVSTVKLTNEPGL
jgi:hypothetical protein